MHSILKRVLILALIFVSVSSADLVAQGKKDKKKKADTEKSGGKKKKKIAELIKSSKRIPGLFPLFQDTVTGSLQMIIKADQIDQEFIHFSQISDGISDFWMVRGMYKGSRVIKIQKYFDKIEFVVQNTSSYFDPNNALSKAADANISMGVIASLKILATNEKKGIYLIKADDLFLKETFSQIKPSKSPNSKPKDFSLGGLQKDKSKILAINNYPKNTNLEIEYVYSKNATINGGSRAVTDGRNVSVKVYHTIMEMPDGNYVPRYDDARVGYFTDQITDMTSKSATPYRDQLHRWRLVKKDTTAELSEPVKPIVWWIENTTPEEIRPIIKSVGEKWNIAFEKAGFKNAVVIKIQPDSAKWDAGDIRYNVLRWTSTPNPLFGGYGPSFVNPRTGEILGADIMLEYASLTNRLRVEKLFRSGSGDFLLDDAFFDENMENESYYDESSKNQPDHTRCAAGQLAHENMMYGMAAIKSLGGGALEESIMVKEYLHFLIMHELGHTFGLNHNMKSSHLHTLVDLHNIELRLCTNFQADWTILIFL